MQACGEGKRRKHAGSGSHNAFQPSFFSNPFIFLDWNGILIEGEVPPAFPDATSEAKPEYSGKELYQKAKKKLGGVYLKKAEKSYKDKQLNLALKLYHEAASYFEQKDDESKAIRKKIKEIKSKLK